MVGVVAGEGDPPAGGDRSLDRKEGHGRDGIVFGRQPKTEGDVTLKVPPLWLYEVGNTLARRFPEEAEALLEVLVAFDLGEGETGEVWRHQAIDLVRLHHVTLYDAAYHALALVEGGLFVTADARYARRVTAVGGVQLLREYR